MWCDVNNVSREEGSIDCTVYVNIYDIWLEEVAWDMNVIDV